MKKFLTLILLLPLLICSCEPDKVHEGVLEYEITYPNCDISGFMQAILPETMTIAFKGTKIKTTIARGEIFTTEIITDELDHSVEMRLDFGDKLIYALLSEEEVKELIASQPVYTIKSLGATDSICDLVATNYSVDCKSDTINRQNAWFTEELAPQEAYWFTSYSSTKGMPLIYDAERYGVMMHLESISLDEREVTDSEFERDPALVKVSFEEYESEVQELFDILLK